MKAIGGRPRSGWDCGAIGVAVLVFHLAHGPAVARGSVFAKDNLAFDFDITRFVALWGTSPFETAQNAAYYAVRHPLAVLLRLLGRPLVATGIEPHVVACGLAAACAAIGSMLIYCIARTLDVGRALAGLLTVLWAFSTTPLLLGVLPEAYGLALAALAWQLLLAARWARGDEPAFAVRILAAVANLGITVTNVALSGLVEFVCRVARQPWRRALIGTVAFGVVVGAIGVTLGAVSFRVWPVENVATSSAAARQLYWSASFAEGDRSRQPPQEVAWTFGAIAFVAPAVARYPSGAPDNPYLYDLRGRGYAAIGWIAVAGWLGLLALGIAAAVRDRALRPFWIVAGAWAAGNIALHSYWQFRQTVFLYAAHPHAAIFVFVVAGARWAQTGSRARRLGYAGVAALVTLLTIANNMPLYLALPRLG